jgi:hypothetical protein
MDQEEQHMSDIPRARAILIDMRDNTKLDEIQRAAIGVVLQLLRRPPPVRKTPARSNKVTAEIVVDVLDIAKNNPKQSQAEIGLTMGINSGRVSEILTGRRDATGALVR